MMRPPPRSPLFPYTPLFRSVGAERRGPVERVAVGVEQGVQPGQGVVVESLGGGEVAGGHGKASREDIGERVPVSIERAGGMIQELAGARQLTQPGCQAWTQR